jgi:serine/threonine protein kinase
MVFSSGFHVDNYTLVAHLGENSFGPVWSARESILNRLVTINFLKNDDDIEVYRFTRATSLISRLNHPAIVKLTGSGFFNFLPYLATEYVPGPTLASLISNGGRMDELRVLQIASQVADALNHGWLTAEIIHRKLSPENILVELASLAEEDFAVRVKITDFGHALGQRLVDQNDDEFVAAEAEFQRLTKSENIGNLLTMAPEQIRGNKLTPAADMYALGVIMYLLLTGKAPFSGSDEQIRNAHVRNAPLDLGSLVPGLQSGTAALVRRLLGKSPEARFFDWASCLERLTALRHRLEAGRKSPVPHERESPVVGNRQSSQDFEAVPSEVHERRRGDEASRALRRKTETFLRTPQGHGVSGGVQGGGVEPSHALNRQSRVEPGPESIATGLIPPTGAPEHHLIFALLAERIRHNSSLLPNPIPVRTMAPTLDDGLTSEQRAAVWSYLFRASAIPEASLSGVHAVAESPDIHSPLSETVDDGHQREPQRPIPPSLSSQISGEIVEEEFVAPELVDDERQLLSTLFVAVDPEQVSNDTTTAPDEVATSSFDGLGRKPTLSPWWKPALEILRVAVIGRVRYQDHASATLTQRFTSRLRRLVANREASLAEVVRLTESGQFDNAERILDQVATRKGAAGNDDQMCLLRSRISALRGDATNAMFWAQVAVGQNSASPLALAIVGYHHLLGRHLAAARAIFEELTNCHPQSALGPLGQACLFFLSGLDTRAEEAMRQGSSRENLPAIIRLSALLCRAKGDIDGELALLRQLLTGTGADWEINERLQEVAQQRDIKTGSSRITVGIKKLHA